MRSYRINPWYNSVPYLFTETRQSFAWCRSLHRRLGLKPCRRSCLFVCLLPLPLRGHGTCWCGGDSIQLIDLFLIVSSCIPRHTSSLSQPTYTTRANVTQAEILYSFRSVQGNSPQTRKQAHYFFADTTFETICRTCFNTIKNQSNARLYCHNT